MSDIPKFSPARNSDLKDTPPWLEKYSKGRDSQIESLTTCLKGQVGPVDNLNVEIRPLAVRQGQPIEFTLHKLRGKPLGGVVLLTSIGLKPSAETLEILDVNKVRLTCSWDTNPQGEVGVTLWVQGG